MFKFFNICDFAPMTINNIDSIAELCLRKNVYGHLDSIKNGIESPKEATENFLNDYSNILNKIILYLEKNDYSTFENEIRNFNDQMNNYFNDILNEICLDFNFSSYIGGMIDAITHFRTLLENNPSIIKGNLKEFVYKF